MTNTGHTSKTPRRATGFFALLGSLLHTQGSGTPKISRGTGAHSPAPLLTTLATIATTTLLASAGLTAALPATASAYATLEGPPTFSSAPGLPDGRVYEQVSPADKNGNEAGAPSLNFTGNTPGDTDYGLVSANGDSVLFETTGPMGETPSAIERFYVATRTSSGWKTRALLPRPYQSAEHTGVLGGTSEHIDVSADLSHSMAIAGFYTLAPLPDEECGGQMYLAGPDPFVVATWLERPEIADPVAVCNDSSGGGGVPVGGTPNFSTVYFAYPGTLLPEDASRAPNVQGRAAENYREAWGYYEDAEGVLRDVGVLPDGSLDPFGAVPAVSGHGVALSGNEVSADGSRAFFVSPDPASCTQNGGVNNCAVDPPEVYVREDGQRTLLVSRDTLLPETNGLPTSAPDGVLQTSNLVVGLATNNGSDASYVFASVDGSQAFFQSEDQLTSTAPEGPPGNTSSKTYDFDVNTGTLTYLPNVAGRIVGSSEDGSTMAFVRPAGGSAPAELDLWSAGSPGGSVTPVTPLPAGENIEPVRMSNDGSVVVFSTSDIPGFNDMGTEQIFRYDAQAGTLGCVSCSPAGVVSSSASMSILRQQLANGTRDGYEPGEQDARGISFDGDRVFFQTAAPLVPQDTNTDTVREAIEREGTEPQGQDVYEWENGVVYLISTGKSSLDSFFLDNSENGNDVFFATTSELDAGDTDGGYSVYDARVPRPGDNPPPAAVPCEGSVCQGPPNVPSPLTPPASATFSGLGNPTPEVTPPPPPAKATTKTVKCRNGFRRDEKNDKCVKNKKKKTKAKKASNDRRVKS